MIAAIIQARMGSTRLPNKVMMELCSKPVLWHVINRVNHASKIDYIIVATTQENADDRIEEACGIWGVPVFRGSTNDVLARFYNAVQFIESAFGSVQNIVRITADCPLIDPQVIDSVVEDMITKKIDYVSNVHPPTYPDGYDIEVITAQALSEAYKNATLASEREHVTPYIRNNPRFRRFNHTNSIDLSSIRLTLDTEKDFLLISQIYHELYPKNDIFLLQDVLNLLEKQPSLLRINAEHNRNEGYKKSLENDHSIEVLHERT